MDKNPTGNPTGTLIGKKDRIGFPMGNPLDNSDLDSTFRSEISIVSCRNFGLGCYKHNGKIHFKILQ